MARIVFGGFEHNSTANTDEVDVIAVPGAISIDSGTVRSGSYSLKVASTANQPVVSFNGNLSNQSTEAYIRVYMYISSMPNANCAVLGFRNTGVSNRCRILLTSTGTLRLVQTGGTQVGSDSAALSTNTWYRLELKNDASTNPGTIEARYTACDASGVDPGGAGTTIASGADSLQGTWGRMAIGAYAVNNTGTLYFDDYAFNDTTGSNQNSWCGSGKVIRLKPNGAGISNTFETQVGGTAGSANNYTRVNEITQDGATSYNASSTLSTYDHFTVDDSNIGSQDIVNVVGLNATIANITAADATSQLFLQLFSVSGGTGTATFPIPNSTTFKTGYFGNLNSYPWFVTYATPEGPAWTKSTLDTMILAYGVWTIGTNPVAVSAIWAIVDYTPVTSTRNSLSLLGVS